MPDPICDLVESFFDDDLNADDRSRFESHLESCAKCQQELIELSSLHESIQVTFGSLDFNAAKPEHRKAIGSGSFEMGHQLTIRELDHGRERSATATSSRQFFKYLIMLGAALAIVVTAGLLFRTKMNQTGDEQVTSVADLQAGEEQPRNEQPKIIRPTRSRVAVKGNAVAQEVISTEEFVIYQVYPSMSSIDDFE